MPSRADPEAELKVYFRRRRPVESPHPAPETLAAYQADRLPPAEEEAVREHLVSCPDCAALVLEFAALCAAPDGDSEVADREVAAAWRRQRSHLFGAAAGETPGWRRVAASPRWAWATAACLALAAAGLGLWTAHQGRILAELRQVQVNPPLINLTPMGSLRQPGTEPAVVRFPPGAPRAWLILNPEAPLDAAAYEVDFVAADGQSRLTLRDLTPSEAHNFRLELPRGRLPAGEYRVRLVALEAGRRRPLEEYAVRLTRP
jgi:Putative zinc-finger